MPPFARTLGTFTLLDGQGGDVLLPAGKPLALLTYLAMADHPEADRDHLLDLLWANLPPERGRHALRQTLVTIRRAIGTDRIETAGDRVRLVGTIASDRADFLEAASRGDSAKAIAIYRGAFLPDLALPGGAGFEHWRDVEQGLLQREWRRQAERVITTTLDLGDPTAAIALALDLRSRDPEHEPLWRLLITSHLQAGNGRAAQVEAEALRRLHAESGRRPQPATDELLGRLAPTGQDFPPLSRQDPLDEPDLVGREQEFARLLAAWRRAVGGQVAHVHLEGDAGIGKSRLLSALTERLAGLGGRAALCRAMPGDRRLPFAFLASVLERLVTLPGAVAVEPSTAATFVRLHPALSATFPGAPLGTPGLPESQHLVAACVDLLRTLAHEATLVMLLDDLHWADPATLEVLSIACARLERSPILCVTTSRYGGGLQGVPAEQVALGAIAPAAIADLLGQLGDPPSADDTAWLVDQIHQQSRGTPLLVLEALRTLLRQGALTLRDGAWGSPDRALVTTVLRDEPPVRRRLNQLPPGARSVLDLVAVAGHPIPANTLAAISTAPAEVSVALGALELAGIVRDTPRGWDVTHDQYAETALGLLTDDDRKTLARGIAHGLLAYPGSDPVADLRHALRHAVDAGEIALLPELGHRWLAVRRRAGARGSATRLLQEYAASAGATQHASELLSARGWWERSSVRAVAAAATLVVGLTAAWSLGSRAESLPVRMQLVSTPLLDWDTAVDPGWFGFAAPIHVLASTTPGIADSTVTDTVEVRVRDGVATLKGAQTLPFVNGEVRFDSLRLSNGTDTLVTLEVTSRRHGTIATVPLRVADRQLAQLHLTGGSINGQLLDTADPRVTVRVGEAITGTIQLRYRSDWTAGSVMLCAVSTWEPGERGVTTIGALATPSTNLAITRSVELAAPQQPGTYQLILVMRAEPRCDWIASQTNWGNGTPSWHDGEDIADITAEELRASRSRGMIDRALSMPHQTAPAAYGLQGIEVVVER